MQSDKGIVFQIGERYEGLKLIGAGSYGTVIKAKDEYTGKFVAIKKLRPIKNICDAKRALREIRILKSFKHDNIIRLKDIIFYKNEDSQEIYLVTNFMEADLHGVISIQENLSELHIQYIIHQITLALKYMHSANVIHRDLKPNNILIDRICNVKICDLGLSRSLDNIFDQNLTEYVMTRYYRAPEIMLSHEYSTAADMWSLGCIMAELITGKTLFEEENYSKQVRLIIETLGKPKDISFITNKSARKFVSELSGEIKEPLSSKFQSQNLVVIDFLKKLLQIDPYLRMNASDALAHPYLKEFYEQENQVVFEGSVDFDFEKKTDLTLEEALLMIENDANSFSLKRSQNNTN